MYDLKFQAFDSIYNYEKLIEINMASIDYCRDIFGIKTPMIKSSQLSVAGAKAERIYNICKKLGATTYIAGLGSLNYMQAVNFKDINIQFFQPLIPNYESSIVYTMKPDLVIPRFEDILLNSEKYCVSK